MTTVHIAFGSNLGRRRSTVEKAIREISSVGGVTLQAVSRLYETSPVGGPDGQRPYLNGVLTIETALPPARLLAVLQRIERAHGRRRTVRWSARTLDLDVVTYGALRLRSPRLTLPHPRYHERRFVLAPLRDVAPDLVHPRLGRTTRELLSGLTSKERVRIIGSWTRSRFQPSVSRKKNASRSSR